MHAPPDVSTGDEDDSARERHRVESSAAFFHLSPVCFLHVLCVDRCVATLQIPTPQLGGRAGRPATPAPRTRRAACRDAAPPRRRPPAAGRGDGDASGSGSGTTLRADSSRHNLGTGGLPTTPGDGGGATRAAAVAPGCGGDGGSPSGSAGAPTAAAPAAASRASRASRLCTNASSVARASLSVAEGGRGRGGGVAAVGGGRWLGEGCRRPPGDGAWPPDAR